ncbi:hypothetical protein FRE64_03715 [Euhalothece natronophila Z-M001]|uniref:Uncharacterized protein n=1 Tax=Euhalothece natronophila Z-M001 TaxID=522448 RepID=A0A5B8NKT5_9CHRO|nr:hypothetical protein [Euhalothece natronophila]QDZ39121.1 hypothetical protein FRE64_03715 [Euhalothece natronophila Z-M001]
MKTLNQLDSKITQEKTSFAKNILGPIFYEFCHLLHKEIHNNYNHDTDIILYMARDGLRLRYLYQLYRQLNNLKCSLVEKDFYISRLACTKSCFYSDFDYVFDYAIKTNPEYIKTIYRETKLVKNYYLEHYIKLKKYLDNLVEKKEKIILVDTGWSGNIQIMLMRSFSQYQWIGLYFGKISRHKPDIPDLNILGISTDDLKHNKYPRSCISSYFLLIEDILNIDFPSAEGYQDDDGIIMPNTGIASESVIAPTSKSNDLFFSGIVEYFKEQSQCNLDQIECQADKAYKKLFRLIKFPKRKEVSMMDCTSNDSPLILQADDLEGSLQTKINRIRQAHWKSGQTTLEFPLPIAHFIHLLKIWEVF